MSHLPDPNNVNGWQSMRNAVKALLRHAGAVSKMQIQRSGTSDSISFAADSATINLAEQPESGPSGGGGGLRMRQFTGSIAVPEYDADAEELKPTEEDYRAALIATYDNAPDDKTPQFGDLITLQESKKTRLVARFWILDNDNVDPNATVSFEYDIGNDPVQFYALNVTYAPFEQIIAALQDFFATPDSGKEPDDRDNEPDASAPFAISVNGFYDTNEDGFLVPAVGNPTIKVNAGSVAATDDISANASGISVNGYSFPGGDGVVHVHLYLKVEIILDGPGKTPSSATATIEHRSTSTAGVPAVSETSFSGNTATKYFTVGVVSLARRGSRRYARINQIFAGNLKAYANGTGSSTPDANGVNTAAGLREVILCINGKPYTTHILTGRLTQVA